MRKSLVENRINVGTLPVCYGDQDVQLVVTRAAKAKQQVGNSISNYKRKTSNVLGGYLTCEKIGTSLNFKIHRAPPTIFSVATFSYAANFSMHTHHNIGWGEEIEMSVPIGGVELTETQPLCSITLSDGSYAIFSQQHITGSIGEEVWVEVGNALEPARLLVQFESYGMSKEEIELKLKKKREMVGRYLFSLTFVVGIIASLTYYLVFMKKEVVLVADKTKLVTTMWSTQALVVATIAGALCNLVPLYVLFFKKKRSPPQTSQVPFVAVLLGWETGEAGEARKSRQKNNGTVYPDKVRGE
tara:strand:- start:25 stop:924 length:900 start_codon:yes stop_codon:yes gene_type:complete